MGKTFSCKNCENRTENCHSTCEIYKNEKKNYDEIQEKRRKFIQDEYYYNKNTAKKKRIRYEIERRG